MGLRWTAVSHSFKTSKVHQYHASSLSFYPVLYIPTSATQPSDVFFCFKMAEIKVYVAISDDGGVYNHWALFIDQPEAETVLNVRGSDGHFRYETEKRDVRYDKSLVKLVYLCAVNDARANTIRNIARRIPVHNDISGWNCQDYVLDLLDELEERKVIDGEDEVYRLHRTYLAEIQEGLPSPPSSPSA